MLQKGDQYYFDAINFTFCYYNFFFCSMPTSMLDVVNDPRSSLNLQKRYLKELCVKVGLAKQINSQNFPVIDDGNYKIEGLKCQTNRTLFFIAIDSLVNHFFAESLGINILNKADKTAAVIIDNKVKFIIVSKLFIV